LPSPLVCAALVCAAAQQLHRAVSLVDTGADPLWRSPGGPVDLVELRPGHRVRGVSHRAG
jgi:hypothetical protein